MKPQSSKRTPTCFVEFGTRAFSFCIEPEELQWLDGHAQILSKSLAALQRLAAKCKDDDSEVENFKCAQAGLEFLSGMVAQMLEVRLEGETAGGAA